MADVDFPSPSTFLDHTPSFDPPCPTLNPPASKTAQPSKTKNAITRRRHSRGKSSGENKPKQTKSRDGCLTCKEKRLKCDETHPTCLQCKRRKVECGGYKKTFTFRSVDKHTFPINHGSSRPKRRPKQSSPSERPPKPSEPTSAQSNTAVTSPNITQPPSPVFDQSLRQIEPPSPSNLDILTLASSSILASRPKSTPDEPPTGTPHNDVENLRSPPYTQPPSPQRSPAKTTRANSPASPTIRNDRHEVPARLDEPEQEQEQGQGQDQIPQFLDDIDIFEPFTGIDEDLFADFEDVQVQDSSGQLVPWNFPSSPISQSSSSASSGLLFPGIPLSIDLPPETSGALHGLFHDQTCGILSIKNGPNENPWATLLYPMIFEDPALYYAVLSMTALHAAPQYPGLDVKGLELMNTSIKLLRSGLSCMRCDTALATMLVLAFSESWHSQIYTGIWHLRGARNLIMQGLQLQERTVLHTEDLARLNFLRGTWVYMDIIARLTALGGDDPDDLDSIAIPPYGPEIMVHEIDPLMGCATTLFPLIGAVATLVKKVRQTQKTPLQLIERAAGLRDQIVKWQVPSQFIPPRDETLEIDHSRHTAEAYKWATLLYLYQSVPMICTQEPAELAELTLRHLAAVPITSRATIIHIFPLLAAGCEAKGEDREFVRQRWRAMIDRMFIGNLNRCLDVVEAVWERRDEAEDNRRRVSPSPHRRESFASDRRDQPVDRQRSPIEEIKTCSPKSLMKRRRSFPQGERSKEQGPGNLVPVPDELTVRGRLHWVAVMSEKKWEILLG